MTRWISSALCTMTLVAVLFCLPVWGIRSTAAVSHVSNTVMSEVHIVKRVPKKAPPVVQETVRPKQGPTIPAPSAEPVPVPEPAEVPNEPAEIPTEETPDDTSASDIGESESNNTAAVTGAEDSFSHTQDAKAVATYKSYALGRIASKKTYPYTARSNGFEGRVRVRIVITPDGTLAQTDILEPSEYEILNKACLTAIKKASPFKKMESGMSAMTLSFVMDFSLK
nr:energy transducer TonB [uncultured Treponema sp.]